MPEFDDRTTPAILPQKFWTEYVEDPENPGKMKGVDWVRWVKIGDTTGAMTAERVDRLMPRHIDGKRYKDHKGVDQRLRPKDRPARPEWAVIAPAYEAWRKNEEIPVDGTPLAAWPGATVQMVEALKKINVRTLEEFVSTPDHALSQIAIPDMRKRKGMAENFLLAQGPVAATQKELSIRDEQIDVLTRKLEEMQTEMRSFTAQAPQPQSTEQPAAPQVSDEDAERDALKAELDERNIEYDGRWGAQKLRDTLQSALQPA